MTEPKPAINPIFAWWAYAFPWLAVALAGGDKVDTPVKLLGDDE